MNKKITLVLTILSTIIILFTILGYIHFSNKTDDNSLPTGKSELYSHNLGKLSKKEAYNLIKERFLDGTTNDKLVYVSDSPLSSKTMVSTYLSIESPENTSWFFFIDDHPNSNYSHPCRYIFVDFNGSIYLYNVGWPPDTYTDDYNISEVDNDYFKSIKVEVSVKYFNFSSVSWETEIYIIEIYKDEYFGIPKISFLLKNNSYCNILDYSKLFKLIEKTDENNIVIWFNESSLYNYTTEIDYSNPNWPAMDPPPSKKIYIENPVNITSSDTLFYPKKGTLSDLWAIAPNPYVEIHLKIANETESFTMLEDEQRILYFEGETEYILRVNKVAGLSGWANVSIISKDLETEVTNELSTRIVRINGSMIIDKTLVTLIGVSDYIPIAIFKIKNQQ